MPNYLPSQTSTDEIFLSVYMVSSHHEGAAVLVYAELPEMYVVKFELTGRVSPKGKFFVHLVNPVAWHPFLKPREVGHLAKALNAAATAQMTMPVSTIHKRMIQEPDMSELPRRKLRLRQND